MHIIAALAVLGLVAAQGANNPIVQVGSTANADGGIFQFIPPSFNATNGTTITFKFTGAPGNHSITQSTFTDPCNPMPGGFDSGWVLIPESNVTQTPEWNLTITNSSKPIWFFCKQLLPGPHCAAGMVGAINAPSTGNFTFAAYKSNAQAFKGDSGQGEGSLVGVGASASAPPAPITGGASAFTGQPITATATGPASPAGTTTSASGGYMLSTNLFLVSLAAILNVVLS